MKKIRTTRFLLLLLAVVAGNLFAARAGKRVRFDELPRDAQRLVQHYFGGRDLLSAVRDSDGYEVKLSDGTGIEFDREGDWREIACEPRTVPEGLVPARIRKTVARRFAGRRIVHIDRVAHGYGVELDNDTELLFTRAGKLVGVEVDD